MFRFDARKLATLQSAISTEKMRPYLNGVFFDGCRAVATDGHIMTIAHGEYNNGDHNEAPVYIDKQTFTMLRKNSACFAEIDDAGIIRIYDKHGFVEHVGQAPTIDGRFPDYRRVLPSNVRDHTATAFSHLVLNRIIQTAKVLAGGSHGCGLTILGNGDDDGGPNLVRYSGHPDVVTLIMPMSEAHACYDWPDWLTDHPQATLPAPAAA